MKTKLKMKIRTLLLAFCLVVTMIPAYTGIAFADDVPTVQVYVDNVEPYNITDHYSDGATFKPMEGLDLGIIDVTVDGNSVTVWLWEVQILSDSGEAGLSIQLQNFQNNPTLNIVIDGENTISTNGIGIKIFDDKNWGDGEKKNINTTISGKGTLNIDSGDDAFYCEGDLNIKEATINAKSRSGAAFNTIKNPDPRYSWTTNISGGAIYASGNDVAFYGMVNGVEGYTNHSEKVVSIVTKHEGNSYTPVCVYKGSSAPNRDLIVLSVGAFPAYGNTTTAGWSDITTGAGVTYGDYSLYGQHTWNYQVDNDSSITLTGNELEINSYYQREIEGLSSIHNVGVYSALNLKLKGQILVGENLPENTGITFGVYCDEDILIDGATINATSTKDDGNAFCCDSLTISGGAVTAGATGSGGQGIYGLYAVAINNSTVTATGGEGIHSGGTLNISDSTVTATGGKGIFSRNTLTISDSTVYAEGNDQAMNTPPSISYLEGTAQVLVSNSTGGALGNGYDVANIARYKQIKVQKNLATTSTHRPSKPTVTTITDNEEEVGGTTEYNGATRTLTITPADGFVIEDVMVNGQSVGAKSELSPIYGWDKIQVKFAKDPNAKIAEGVKATTLKILNIKAYKNKGKNRIKMNWEKSKGFKVDFYRIYRAVGNGEFEMFYTTKTNKCRYVNTKNVLKGVKYKFKIVGVRIVDGKEVTTQTSMWRSALGK